MNEANNTNEGGQQKPGQPNQQPGQGGSAGDGRGRDLCQLLVAASGSHARPCRGHRGGYAALSSLSQTMRSCGSVGCLIRYLRNLPPGPGNRFVTT